MKSLWTELYDRAKDRRYASLYMLSSILIVGICLGAVFFEQIYRESSEETRRIMMVVAVVLFLALAGRWVAGFRMRRRQRREVNYSQLSSDELSKARSKLMKNRNRNSA